MRQADGYTSASQAGSPRHSTVGRAVGIAAVAAIGLTVADGVRLRAEPSSTPRLDWLFNATVSATARVGNTLHVGGWFTSVAPTAGELSRLFALSPTTGAPIPGLPAVNGGVLGIVSDGAGGYYVTGNFTNIGSAGPGQGGQPSAWRIAHVLANGAVDAGFRPQVGGLFNSVVRVGPSLVVVGILSINGGTTARNLVALDAVTGALSPWNPVVPGAVFSLTASGGVLFVATSDGAGGKRVSAFDSATGGLLWTSPVLGGASSPPGPVVVAGSRLVTALDRLYALDLTTGALDPAWGSPAAGPGTEIAALSVSGTALYVAGSFSEFNGQPRANLAAVDVATGVLLPWAPQASSRVALLVASPNGGVFAMGYPPSFGAQVTIGGQQRPSGIFEIDATGAVTSWSSQAIFFLAALYASPGGPLVVGSVNVPSTGNVARNALAGFDLTSGALAPTQVTFGSATGVSAVTSLVSLDQTLFMSGQFDTVNGQPRANVAAVDATSNTVLPWPSAPLPPFGTTMALAHGSWVYVYLDTAGPLRRVHAVTGELDPVWRAERFVRFRSVDLTLAIVSGQLYAGQGYYDAARNEEVLVLGRLDDVTGAMHPLVRAPGMVGAVLTIDGDTAYLAFPVRGFPNDVGAITAYDLRTGARVSAPPVTGQLNGITAADGRLFAYGGTFGSGATSRVGVAELLRPNGFTAWDTGAWRLDNADSLVDRGVSDVRAHGNVLVVFGLRDSFPVNRVATYDLSGVSVPSNLRTQVSGASTVFTWDPMATPPPGGYVIEGGFAAGQAAAALPVGNATSVTLPMPAGPIFVRVRPQRSTEVSNEIVAGCVAPPLPPTALTTTLSGTALTLAWTAPADAVTSYTLLAGTATGLSDAATLALGPQTSISGAVPGGTFFARVTAANACGTSGPSGEVFFTIGAPDPLPAAPANLTSSVSSNTVTLSWTVPAGPVTGYVIEAGTGAGLANLGTLQIGAASSIALPGVPAGTYAVRLRAITSAGSGAPSADVVVVVP